MEILSKLSSNLFNWVLHTDKSDYQYLSNNGGHGLAIALAILLVVSLLVALIYYFVLSKTTVNATKKNYISVGIMGMIVMVLLYFLIIKFMTDFENILFSANMWKLIVISCIYYLILYGIVWSELFREIPGTRAKNISLIQLLKELF